MNKISKDLVIKELNKISTCIQNIEDIYSILIDSQEMWKKMLDDFENPLTPLDKIPIHSLCYYIKVRAKLDDGMVIFSPVINLTKKWDNPLMDKSVLESLEVDECYCIEYVWKKIKGAGPRKYWTKAYRTTYEDALAAYHKWDETIQRNDS